MSPLHPAGPNAAEHRPARSIAVRIANATTRLILLAIVAGGLVTVVLNISQLRSAADSDVPSTEPDEVAPPDLLPPGFPLARAVVRGDEAAARDAIVRVGREKLSSEAERIAAMPNPEAAAADHADPFAGALELAADANGKWRILETRDLKRIIIGVLHIAPDPAIVFWGGYDQTGPGEWSTWTMQLPLPEK